MDDNNETGRSLITPVVMTLLASAAVVLLWAALREDHDSRIADVVEAVSYSARSELASQLIVQMRAFGRVRDFWSEYAPTPVDEWQADARIEIDHFAGLIAIAWTDREGPRFFSSGPNIALDRAPTDGEWETIQDSLEEAYGVESDSVVGPTIDDDGHARLRLYLPGRDRARDAVMIAIIDVTEQLDGLLENESPGYDIRVSCCDGIELYRSGDLLEDIPDSWRHGGLIEPIEGVLWQVDHQPSAELASDFRPWALNTVLIVGLALALAIGAIAYHSRRADERARDARKAERQVRTLNLDLERRVERRTRDLNDALSDLETISLSVAHDVRSPLNAAGLTVESLLIGNGNDSRATAQLNRVKSGLDQINFILDRLMVLSNVSSFKTEREHVDLRALALQVAEELKANGGEAVITVDDLPSAYVDPTMAHILLTNLVSNAIRHASSGAAATIEIGSRRDGVETTYYVRDHGPGIDPDKRDELFKPARRTRSETSNGGGLGLGLAIAERVVARHGGAIWVEDTAGGGATFCFRLSDAP